MTSLIILLWACGWVVALSTWAIEFEKVTVTDLLFTLICAPIGFVVGVFHVCDGIVLWKASK